MLINKKTRKRSRAAVAAAWDTRASQPGMASPSADYHDVLGGLLMDDTRAARDAIRERDTNANRKNGGPGMYWKPREGLGQSSGGNLTYPIR